MGCLQADSFIHVWSLKHIALYELHEITNGAAKALAKKKKQPIEYTLIEAFSNSFIGYNRGLFVWAVAGLNLAIKRMVWSRSLSRGFISHNTRSERDAQRCIDLAIMAECLNICLCPLASHSTGKNASGKGNNLQSNSL